MARADPRPVIRTVLVDPGPVDPAARVDQADPDPAARVDLDPTDQADQADPARVDPVDLAAPDLTGRAARVARVDPTAPAARADPVVPARGMATTTAVTSTARRGVTDPHPGERVNHRIRTGTDRSHRPAGSGGMAPSTTGATTKTPSGIRSSTNGALTSSESGFRCK
jgi:hypothetical protein